MYFASASWKQAEEDEKRDFSTARRLPLLHLPEDNGPTLKETNKEHTASEMSAVAPTFGHVSDF